MPPTDPRTLKIQELAKAIRKVELAHHARLGSDRILSTGIAPLDAILTDGGLRPGSLVEWLVPGDGCGADTLAFLSLRSILHAQGNAIVVDSDGTFYPPAIEAWGVDRERLLIVRPKTPAEALWAIEQCLSCPAVSLVIGWPGSLTNIGYRKLKVAAEAGGGIGFLMRSMKFQSHPAWADVRLRVDPLPTPSGEWDRRIHVEVISQRGAVNDGQVTLRVSDAGEVSGCPVAARPKLRTVAVKGFRSPLPYFGTVG